MSNHARVYLAVIACLTAVSAVAQDAPSESTTPSLEARVQELESLVRELRRESGPGSSYENAQVEQTSFEMMNASAVFAPGGETFPTVRLEGFFQADIGWVHQGAANLTAVGDAQDGTGFRRARLNAAGKVAENVSYMLEMDFGFAGRPSFMDVWGEVHDLEVLQNVRFGQYRQPFGLDGLTSVKELTFIERALPFAFLPFRQTGVMAYGSSANEDMTWWFSGFRAPVDVFANNTGDNGGYGLATRLTGVLVDDGACIVHIGGAYSLIDPSNSTARYRSQPEFFVTDETLGSTPFFVDTQDITVEHVNLFAGEFAATSGSWHSQAELIYAAADQTTGGTATFSGASAQVAYILTGEHRPYNSKSAVLGRVVPHQDFGAHGCGAWEIGARWSYLDLNDSGINGGRLNTVTGGLNWYLNRYTKLQLNYTHAFLESQTTGDSDADIVSMRAHLDF